MAIQIPNPGTGNGATGDNEFVMWSKVKDNFSNQAHAASRLVGTASGNLVEMTVSGVAGAGLGSLVLASSTDAEFNNPDQAKPNGFYAVGGTASTDNNTRFVSYLQTGRLDSGSYKEQLILKNDAGTPRLLMRVSKGSGTGLYSDSAIFYSTANTKLDSNGFLKPSSPVLEIYHDKMVANRDGERMAATYTKNGVGDYTISGTTGLRTDGWYVVTPNDMNGNPKVAITLDDKDGVITLKTYVRIFDISTFKFVPDLNQPLDIPDGRWIDLRFNDLPDDAQTEV